MRYNNKPLRYSRLFEAIACLCALIVVARPGASHQYAMPRQCEQITTPPPSLFPARIKLDGIPPPQPPAPQNPRKPRPSLKPPWCNPSILSHKHKPAAARPCRAPKPAWRPWRHSQRAHPRRAAPQHPASRPLDTVPSADRLVLHMIQEVPAGASETRRRAVRRIVQVRELRPVTALHGSR
jgi:hypothetical protein